MDKRIKVLVIVVISLGVISSIFLLTSKKKDTSIPIARTITLPQESAAPVKAVKKSPATAAVKTPIAKTPAQLQAEDEAKKKLLSDQWSGCKAKTFSNSTTLFWNVKISEAIPVGGSYAKGILNNDAAQLVHIIIKSDAKATDSIKSRLVVGKTAFVRGNCIDVATDGAVVLQAF